MNAMIFFAIVFEICNADCISPSALLPMHVLHIPKCGTSFELFLKLAACPKISQNASKAEWESMWLAPWSYRQRDFLSSCAFSYISGGHRPLFDVEKRSGKIVTILRDPITRIASGFVHNLHDCRRMQAAFRCPSNELEYSQSCTPRVWELPTPIRDSIVLEYAHCVGACATNMLVGKMCDAPTSDRDIAQAQHVMLTHVGYVGLTHRWTESMRVFCKIFNIDPCPLWHHYRSTGNSTVREQVAEILRKSAFQPRDKVIVNVAEELLDKEISNCGF